MTDHHDQAPDTAENPVRPSTANTTPRYAALVLHRDLRLSAYGAYPSETSAADVCSLLGLIAHDALATRTITLTPPLTNPCATLLTVPDGGVVTVPTFVSEAITAPTDEKRAEAPSPGDTMAAVVWVMTDHDQPKGMLVGPFPSPAKATEWINPDNQSHPLPPSWRLQMLPLHDTPAITSNATPEHGETGDEHRAVPGVLIIRTGQRHEGSPSLGAYGPFDDTHEATACRNSIVSRFTVIDAPRIWVHLLISPAHDLTQTVDSTADSGNCRIFLDGPADSVSTFVVLITDIVRVGVVTAVGGFAGLNAVYAWCLERTVTSSTRLTILPMRQP